MNDAAKSFLDQIEAFLERTEMSPTAFGRLALKDPSFVRDLRDGRMPNLGLVDRVNKFMASHEEAAQ